MTREASLLGIIEGANRFRQGNLFVRPMNQQQVDLVDSQPLQACLGGPLQRAIRDVFPPDLGRNPDLVAGDAAGTQPLPDRLFVRVHLSRVDMAVAARERSRDRTGAFLIFQGPRSEADHRDRGAVAD